MTLKMGEHIKIKGDYIMDTPINITETNEGMSRRHQMQSLMLQQVDLKEFEEDITNNLEKCSTTSLAAQNQLCNDIDIDEFETPYTDKTLEIVKDAMETGVIRNQGIPIYTLEDGISGYYARRKEYSGGSNSVVLNCYVAGKSMSEDIVIDNYDVITIYWASQEGAGKEQRNEGQRIIKKISKKLTAYSFDGVIINPQEIIHALMSKYSQLPWDRQHLLDINMVYSAIVDLANLSDIHQTQIIRRGFYALNDYYFDMLANSLASTKQKVLDILKQNELLYIQKSSGGLQSKVKGNGKLLLYLHAKVLSIKRGYPET